MKNFLKTVPSFKNSTLAFVTGCGFLLTACAGVVSDFSGSSLNGQAIQKHFFGHSMVGGVEGQQGTWAIYSREDGYAIFRSPSGRLLESQWAVQGDRYCLSAVREIEKLCFDVAHNRGQYRLSLEENHLTLLSTAREEGDFFRLKERLESQKALSDE